MLQQGQEMSLLDFLRKYRVSVTGLDIAKNMIENFKTKSKKIFWRYYIY